MKNFFKHLFIVSSVFLVTTVASASTTITGNGSWNSNAASTAYSAPNATWSFSFIVPNPVDSNPTKSISSFVYQLNGRVVAGSPMSIEFFDSDARGLFDIDFNDSTLALYGVDIYNQSTLSTGIFSADIEFFGQDVEDATGSGTVAIGAVPELSTYAYFLLGMVLLISGTSRSKRDGAHKLLSNAFAQRM